MAAQAWRTCAIAALSVAATCSITGIALGSGMAWEAEMTTAGSEPQVVRVLTAPQRFKIQPRDGGTEYLVRLDRGEVYFIDAKKRTYQKVQLTELERAAANAREHMQLALKHMQKELESLPPEQRRLLEHMVGERQAAATKAKVRKTGKTKTIAGYRCSEYVAEAEGKTLLTACTTDQIPAFRELRKDWLTAQQRLGKLNPFGGRNLQETYGEIPGFPLETEMGGVRAVVTKVDTTAPPETEFEVPQGFELRPGPPLPR
ncbi:MAG: DUF4412 domain-containing protein [Candidatus Binatia bacterium]|nr:DUF4412 domain-containing protein [Candidatus Binatia bacterium]